LGALNGHKLSTPLIKNLGLREYQSVWQAMQDFSKVRDENTPDELWIVEHPSVYTLGRNGKEAHILNATTIPIIKADRGGQVTYHGPGQLIIYALIDLKRKSLGVRRLVTILEESIVELLADYKIKANSDPKAPGVYVDNKKVAALGLRVSRGCTTHGLSLNINMDLTPFDNINPCGYEGLEVTQCKDLGVNDSVTILAKSLSHKLISKL
jgi:lipoyl(octanoyl) transferase